MGIVEAGAEVTILNKNTDQIVGEITDDTGRYDLQMSASVGDRLAVRQRVGTKQSPPTEVVVPEVSDILDGMSPPPGVAGSPSD